ncbi:hypothetical protein GOODEAATRI_002033, partial [Goodea atripinnis]
KYTPLMSVDQRQNYKDDFNGEYDEYRQLHARVESITRRFTQLDALCRKLVPGTKEHQVLLKHCCHLQAASHLLMRPKMYNEKHVSASRRMVWQLYLVMLFLSIWRFLPDGKLTKREKMAQQFAKAQIKGDKVVVFLKPSCPYCVMAEDILSKYQFKPGHLESIDISGRSDMDSLQDYFLEITGARTRFQRSVSTVRNIVRQRNTTGTLPVKARSGRARKYQRGREEGWVEASRCGHMTRQRDFRSLRLCCWYSLSSCRYPLDGQRSLSTCSRSSSGRSKGKKDTN